MFIRSLLILSLLFSAGCGVVPKDYAGERPVFRLEEYFLGRTVAHGVVQDRAGKVIKRMVVELDGTQEGGEFVLRERFRYADGTSEFREWRIRKLDEGRYEGRASDVVGVATGIAAGNALSWRYTLRVPVGDSIYALAFDDWMWLLDDGVLINRASFSKFGVHLGDVTLSFRKPSAE
jgi:hypothetical protein